jgi:hypothetical protein
MGDPIAWLNAQLDADERHALKVPEDERHWYVNIEGDIMPADAGGPAYIAVRPWGGGIGDPAEHIARHDPARVLAEVEAQRRQIREHSHEDGCCRTCTTEEREVHWDSEEETVQWERRPAAWPCLTVRLLALPYADRDDFPDELRLPGEGT